MGDTQSEFRDSQQLVWLGPEDLCQTLAEKEDEQSEVTEVDPHAGGGADREQPQPAGATRERERRRNSLWRMDARIQHFPHALQRKIFKRKLQAECDSEN